MQPKPSFILVCMVKTEQLKLSRGCREAAKSPAPHFGGRGETAVHPI